jgi:hypothetical protein
MSLLYSWRLFYLAHGARCEMASVLNMRLQQEIAAENKFIPFRRYSYAFASKRKARNGFHAKTAKERQRSGRLNSSLSLRISFSVPTSPEL